MVQSGCRFSRDVPPYIVASGHPISYGGINSKILTNHGVEERVMGHIANAYRLVFHGQTSVFDAVMQIKEQVQLVRKYVISLTLSVIPNLVLSVKCSLQ